MKATINRRSVLVSALLLANLGSLSACGGPQEVSSSAEPTAATGDDLRDDVTPLVGDNTGTVPECVTVTGQAIYGAFGYNHLVAIENGCAQDASCSVATDVNPEATDAEVAAGQRVELTTFRGSPASAFTPHVDCQLH